MLSAQLEFADPTPGTSPITSFQVSINSGAAQTLADDRVVPGLVAGVNYSFRVSGCSGVVCAPWSLDSNVITALPPISAPAVIGSVAASPGNQSASLTFAAPANGGSPITAYEVSVNNGAAQTLASNGVVTGLTNGVSYSFRVQACNAVGCAALSSPSDNVTPLTVPSTPTVSVSVGGATISWSWNIPAGNGGAVTSFEVRLDGVVVQGGLSTSFSRGFGYSETHTLSVAAINSAGKGSAGSASGRTVDPPTRVVSIYNKVTNGLSMSEDTPAYLSTLTKNFCKRDGCALSGTDMSTGFQLTVVCWRLGDRTTNGNDGSAVDDANPELYSSTRWYRGRWADGREGWISEVWVNAVHRGGLGLPSC